MTPFKVPSSLRSGDAPLCHGPNLVEGPGPELVGDEVTPGTSYYPVRYWPFAPLIFDYVRHAMPYDRPGILSADETYALTAFLLHRNGIIEEDDVMDAKSLLGVVMPHRSRHVDRRQIGSPGDHGPGRCSPDIWNRAPEPNHAAVVVKPNRGRKQDPRRSQHLATSSLPTRAPASSSRSSTISTRPGNLTGKDE